jgi:hypothetical protein
MTSISLTCLRGPVAVLVAAAALSSCGGEGGGGIVEPPPTPPPPPPAPPAFALTSVQPLVPGATARLTGTAFNTGLPAILTVDGQSVPVARVSDTEATFVVPAVLRACDTDGRRVAVTAAAATLQGTLDLPDTVALAPGQSQLLAAAEVACLKLPAADQDYVLTALNLEDYPIAVDPNAPPPVRALLNLTTHTAAGGEPTGSFTPSVPMVHRAWNPSPYDPPRVTFSADPVPFDPNYATAKLGEVVRFVDWSAANRQGNGNPCTVGRVSAPWYNAQIVAVVRDAPNNVELVIAADMRHAAAAEQVTESGRQFWGTAASIAAPLLAPTMRALFDPAFQPLAGGGRRVYVLVGNTFGAAGLDSDGFTGQLQASCPLASEMTTVLLSPSTVNRTTLMARDAAKNIVHEYAHNAEQISGWRLTGYARGAGAWMSEAFAVQAEETAVRLASGQDVSASEVRVTDAHPFYIRSASVWGGAPHESPFRGIGEYELGGSVLLFAREALGDASVTAPGPHLYERLLRRDAAPSERWTLAALAGLVGLGAADFLDRWALAHATDDLVHAAAAAAQGLPQFRSWDHSAVPMDSRDARYRNTSRKVARTANARRTLGAQPGSYAAAYFFAEGGAGVSLSLTSPASQARFRLTRLR